MKNSNNSIRWKIGILENEEFGRRFSRIFADKIKPQKLQKYSGWGRSKWSKYMFSRKISYGFARLSWVGKKTEKNAKTHPFGVLTKENGCDKIRASMFNFRGKRKKYLLLLLRDLCGNFIN